MPPMGQKKLHRFAAIKTFSNVLENPVGMPGQWNILFKNNNPIVLELACGKGEYAVALSKLYQGHNFIGIDITGNRIYVGAKKCRDDNISNLTFLRNQIQKLPEDFFPG